VVSGTDEAPLRDLEAACFGGGRAYVGRGEDIVLLAFTQDVGWWRNAVVFTPEQARRVAANLVKMADAPTRPEDPS
jgi:hypothetical protein